MKIKVKYDSLDNYPSCKECGTGTMEEIEDEEDEDEEEEDEMETCIRCKKKTDDTYSCDECDEEPICESCMAGFDSAEICLKCCKKKVGVEEKIVYKDKIIEKPIIKYVDKNTNQEVSINKESKSSSVFDSVF